MSLKTTRTNHSHMTWRNGDIPKTKKVKGSYWRLEEVSVSKKNISFYETETKPIYNVFLRTNVESLKKVSDYIFSSCTNEMN